MGRSGLVMRMGAMRLAQLGLPVHVTGETTTPALRSGDWLIAFSGSGRTGSVRVAAEEAQAVGGRVLAVTADAGSPLARAAQAVLLVPAAVKDDHSGRLSAQFSGSLFEQGCLLILDGVFHLLSHGLPRQRLWAGHTNIE
jgi:6-phospho-3-hexuloisomerase